MRREPRLILSIIENELSVMNDDELFGAEMSDVEPLNREPRERIVKASVVDYAVRRAAAVDSVVSRDSNALVDDGVEPLDARYVLDFKRAGIQNGVYRKLRLGHYDIEARLDLHRMTVAESRTEVWSFFQESRRLGLRTVLITHGKGLGNKERQGAGILKGYVNRWLREIEDVQAFHSATAQHG